MIRVARTPSGVMVDDGQVLPGRGAYVHPTDECMDRAIKRGGLQRTLRCAVPVGLFRGLEAARNG